MATQSNGTVSLGVRPLADDAAADEEERKEFLNAA